MNVLLQVIYAMAATSSLIGVTEQARLNQLIAMSQEIAPGASQAEVRAKLGPPIAEWDHTGFSLGPFSSSGPPQWAYGTVLEPRYILRGGVAPIPLPLHIRLFGPDDEHDLVVTWDDQGRVVSVARP